MGRELKRVPLDFDWPIGEVWHGFINDKHKPCPEEGKTCFHGWTSAGEWLNQFIRLIMLAGEDARRGELHPWLQEMPLGARNALGQLVLPSPEFAQLTTGLAGRELSFMGHDACDKWAAGRKIKEVAGVSDDWGICPVCQGHCVDPDVKEEYDAWELTEPPSGPGYQLWDTTSEGSPISPVFEMLWELAEWAAENATTFGSSKATADEWEKMLAEDDVHHKEGSFIFI